MTMKRLVIILSLGVMLFGCGDDDGGGGGGTGGGTGGVGGGSGGSDGVGPVAPMALECDLLGNDATLPFSIEVELASEPQIGQPVDATITVAQVLPVELVCGILAAGFTSVDVQSGSNTVTITGVSAPDPAEATVVLADTPITGIEFADGCGCADPGQGDLVPPCGTGPGLEFAFDPVTVSVTPDGASTMDFLITVDGVNLGLANLVGGVTIPALILPDSCGELRYLPFIGSDPDDDAEFNDLATPPTQVQIPVLCDGVDCNDDNDCTANACVDGACSSTNVADDTPCDAGAGLCQAGTCVDRCDDVTCEDDGEECTDEICNPVAWLRQVSANPNLCESQNKEDGTSCDSGNGVCTLGLCVSACTGVDCDDGNDCTIDGECDPETGECPAKQNAPDDSECMDNTGTCQAGVCVLRCADAETRCDDENECTDDDCNTADGSCINTPLTGTACGVDGMQGTCNAGVCETGGLCQGVDCSDGNECTQDLCEPSDGTCSNPDLAKWTSCAGGNGFCDGAGTCENQAIELLAIDCELLGNSAALPISSKATPLDAAFAGQAVDVTVEDAIVLPADLVCGFIGAGFQTATVANSQIEATYTNADLTSSTLTSFLDDGSAGGGLVSPHLDTVFQFGEACGDNCVDGLCKDGVTACALSTFTQDCPDAGTGPGVAVPFLANGPGSIPPGTDPVALTPTAAGTVDIGLPYSGIALNLPDVGGIASGCAGGACSGADLCMVIDRSFGTDPSLPSPRVMYDATCNKEEFDGESCEPFGFFATLGDIVKGVGIDAVADFNNPEQLPACTEGICGLLTTPTDFFCTSDAAKQACSTQLATDFPTATAAQLPKLPVSAAP